MAASAANAQRCNAHVLRHVPMARAVPARSTACEPPRFWQYVLPGSDALGYCGCTGTNFCVRARCLAQVRSRSAAAPLHLHARCRAADPAHLPRSASFRRPLSLKTTRCRCGSARGAFAAATCRWSWRCVDLLWQMMRACMREAMGCCTNACMPGHHRACRPLMRAPCCAACTLLAAVPAGRRGA